MKESVDDGIWGGQRRMVRASTRRLVRFCSARSAIQFWVADQHFSPTRGPFDCGATPTTAGFRGHRRKSSSSHTGASRPEQPMDICRTMAPIHHRNGELAHVIFEYSGTGREPLEYQRVPTVFAFKRTASSSMGERDGRPGGKAAIARLHAVT